MKALGSLVKRTCILLCWIFGTAYTKCGFGDETGPRAIIPSRVTVDGHERSVFDYRGGDDLYRLLVELMQKVYFRRLLVNPKDRPVVVVESLLTPSLFRNVLANVLFRHYEVSSVLLAPSHLMALLPLGLQTGLVLDIGHREAVCIPVYCGVPVLRSWQALPLGAQAVHR
ncbi:actin-related protein 10-like [Pollicipes pollicipes]|uniref:actin-related protein 10-like n=1 Tax=Pollicipes pollicipes TaxID=41117 RepID=UPI001885142C|nr:actin-related protein 10-like [Pollicipes pollicipes]